MAGTVVAVFDDNSVAERAAQALVDDGVPLADITLVFHGAAGATGTPHDGASRTDTDTLATGVREVEEHDVERPVNLADEAGPRAVVGFVVGAPLGSLAMSLLVFFEPLLPSIAAHALVWQLSSAVIGGILGAIAGVVMSSGIPKEAARGYHKDVQGGKTLVTALASSHNAPHFQEMLRGLGGRKLGYFPRFLDTLQSIES
ncbi:MAG: hypothetical protein ACRYFS_08660 [Janthinobacterium lividum]